MRKVGRLAFVPPPAEATLAVRDELPEAVEQRRRDYYLAEGEKPTFDRVELVRRDMEHSALRDLPTVMRLVAHGRVAVSATTRRPSAAGMLLIAEVLDGGDFYDPGMKKEKRWEQVIGPIRAFAWPMLLQAAKLAEPQGSKLALTKAGHAVLAKPPEETLRRLWERWLPNTLLDEFSRVDDIKGQQSGKGRRAMTAAANRRPPVAEALRHCPVGRWVHFIVVAEQVAARQRDPEVRARRLVAEPEFEAESDPGVDGQSPDRVTQAFPAGIVDQHGRNHARESVEDCAEC